MRRKIDPVTITRLVLLFLLFLLAMYIWIASQSNIEIGLENVPTATATPTAACTPIPTITATATPEPTMTLVPTQKVELPDISEILIQEALKEVEERLEAFSAEEITLYNTYSEEELDLLFRVVEAEATDYSVECKSHVASVIFNRLKAGWWGGDLTKNLMASRQFAVITNGRYKKVTVTQETILACEIAFDRDTAQGALFFDSTKGKSWAHKNQEFIFSDDAHWFYK